MGETILKGYGVIGNASFAILEILFWLTSLELILTTNK